MPKNPTRMLSIRLGGRVVGVGDGDGEGVGEGVGVGVGEGDGVGVGPGEGLAEGAGDGRGAPGGRFASETRMRSGRVGSSSVTVQPHAAITANPASQQDSLMGPLLETT
jgi:hypothetical protein